MISGTTQVTAPIAPTSLIDIYPTHDAEYGLDGLRNVNTITDRNNIPNLRRRAGMLVGLNDGTYWRLKNVIWDSTNNDWEPFVVGSTNTYSNGLTYNLGNVRLGGTLLQNTQIDGQFSTEFGTNAPLTSFVVTTGDYSTNYSQYYQDNLTLSYYTYNNLTNENNQISISDSVGLQLFSSTNSGLSSLNLYSISQLVTNNGTNNTIVIEDTVNNKGIVYNSDYSANFTFESLITKRYADTLVSNYIPLTQKGAANGVATLDGGGKIPVSQLASSVMQYQGQWNANTNTPVLIDGTGDIGDVWEVTIAGTQDLGSGNIIFKIGDWVVYNGTIWEKSINSNEVVSVNGFVGAVTLTTTNINEGTNLYYTDTRVQTYLTSISAVTGIITQNQIGYGNALNQLTSNSNFTYNGSTVAIGTTPNASYKFFIDTTTITGLAIKNVSTDALDILDASNNSIIKIDTNYQLSFNTGINPITLGTFGNYSNNILGFLTGGQVLQSFSANTNRIGFGGVLNYFETNEPLSFIEVRGKLDEVQFVISPFAGQISDIFQIQDEFNNPNIVVDYLYNLLVGQNIGIGFFSSEIPSEKLHIKGGSVLRTLLQNTDVTGGYSELQLTTDLSDVRFGTAGTGTSPYGGLAGSSYIGNISNNGLIIVTNNLARAYFQNSGEFGLNTLNPLRQLHAKDGIVLIESTNSTDGQLQITNSALAKTSILLASQATINAGSTITALAKYTWNFGLGVYSTTPDIFGIGNGTNGLEFSINAVNGNTFIRNLSGTGNRIVEANASGILSATVLTSSLATVVQLGNYLPLAGGLMSGNINVNNGFEIGRFNLDINKIQFTNSSILLNSYNNTSSYTSSIEFNSSITDNTISIYSSNPNFKGAEYDIDYSTNYTNRSLVDKEYVDNTVINTSGIINITRAALLTLRSTNALIKGKTYKLTDNNSPTYSTIYSRGFVYMKALENNLLSKEAIRLYLCPSFYKADTDIHSNVWIGVWNNIKTVNIDELTIWGGLVWKNLTGNIGTALDDITLDATNWILISQNGFTNFEYEEIEFNVLYDIDNNWFEKQSDNNGNIVGIDYYKYTDYGLSYYPTDVTDWNFIKGRQDGSSYLYENIVPLGIFNNSGDIITNNKCVGDDPIKNNTTIVISNNDVYGIMDNNGPIEISRNYASTITNNINIGYITNNNINRNQIASNTANVTNISNNTNNGNINSNDNTGSIEYNSILGSIISNSNLGDISYNTDNIKTDINNLSASYTNVYKDQLYNDNISGNDVFTIDITGLTQLDYGTNSYLLKDVVLISTNSTETISTVINLQSDLKVKTNAEFGLIVNYTHGTGLNQPRLEGAVNTYSDGTYSEWIEFEKSPLGIVRQSNIGSYI